MGTTRERISEVENKTKEMIEYIVELQWNRRDVKRKGEKKQFTCGIVADFLQIRVEVRRQKNDTSNSLRENSC